MKTAKNMHYVASFMIGMGSVLNIAPSIVDPIKASSPNDDLRNIQKDWQALGKDIKKALKGVQNV